MPLTLLCLIAANAFAQIDDGKQVVPAKKSFTHIVSKPDFINAKHQDTKLSQEALEADRVYNQNIMPVRCFVSESEQNRAVIHKPHIVDELTGKPLKVLEVGLGIYEFTVIRGRQYYVSCNVVGYKRFTKSVNISSEVKGELNTYSIIIRPYRENENFVLRDIYFYPNTPVFMERSNNELRMLHAFMKNNPSVVISIEGHTNGNRRIPKDPQREQIGGKWAFSGSSSKLSKERANEVKQFLVTNGIPSERIQTKGWGGRKELYPNAKTLNKSMKNMRVEVHIVKR